jgi:hypothetical protein
VKHAKLAGIATALALALVAISFTSSAMAAKTCSTSGTGAACAAGHGNELATQTFIAPSPGTRAVKVTSGFLTTNCDARLEGEFTHEGKGQVTSWTFSNCTSSVGACTSVTANASSLNPYSVTTTSLGSGNGSLAITASPVTAQFTCAGVTCKYTTPEMGGKNGSITVTGGEPATVTLSSISVTKEEGSSGFCSSTATWEGSYTFTSPTSLWIE